MPDEPLPLLFTAHAIHRLKQRFSTTVSVAAPWLREAKVAHKSHVTIVEGLYQREHKRVRADDGRFWMTNIDNDAAFLVLDGKKHRVVITVLRVRLRAIARHELTEMRDGKLRRNSRKSKRRMESELE